MTERNAGLALYYKPALMRPARDARFALNTVIGVMCVMLLTFIGEQLIICAFARGRRCARLIICYGRRYSERTCVECGKGGWLEETMQQMRRAVIKKALSIVRKLKEDSESTR